MATSVLRGHRITSGSGEWCYADTGEPTVGGPRPCGSCSRKDRADGHDACLGELKGLMNACCGHGGTSLAYVQFLDGSTVQGEDATTILEILKRAEGFEP